MHITYPFVPVVAGSLFVVVLLTIKPVIRHIKVKQRRKVLVSSGIRDIDLMKGRTFEEYLQAVFIKKGYKVELTKASKDQGADLVISQKGTRTVIQAKRYKSRVGNHAIQEIVASKPFYHADRAMVVTNSFFTKSAKELAKANQVELWDRNKLISELVSAHVKQ